MLNVRSLLVMAVVGAWLLAAPAGAQLEVEPEVLFTVPAVLPDGPLMPPPTPAYVIAFAGQPRVANDGTWYSLYRFPLPPSPTPIEFTRDYVMLNEGIPYIREGLQIPAASEFAPIADQAFSQQPFFDISIAGDGAVAQIIKGTDEFGLLPDGTPDPADLDFPVGQRDLLLVDRALVAQVGDEVDLLPGVEFPRNAIESLSSVKAASATRLLVKADLDTGEGTFDPDTTVVYEVTDPGEPTENKVLRFTTEDTLPIPGLGFNLSSLNSNEEDIDYNAGGSILIGIDIEGAPFDQDGAIVYYDALTDTYELIAREGEPSPLEGRNFDGLFNNPLALNDAGDIAFLASVNGSFDDDGLLIVNDEIVAQEAMTVGTAVPGPLQLGFANANVEMDDEGNIIWYGAWNAPKDDYCPDNPDITSPFIIFEGIFLNDQLILQGGVTEVHDVVIDGQLFPTLIVKDLPNTGFGGFHVSPDGRWLIVHALLAEPSDDICAFSINNDATPVAGVLLRIDLDQIGAAPPGDLNCDGVVNGFDIDPFVIALTDPDGYAALFPDCDRTLADINGDGTVDGFDIDPFVLLLTGN